MALSKPSVDPQIFKAAFLNHPSLQKLITALGLDADQVRIIGGAVRNALQDFPITDIDLATIHHPEKVIKRAERAGFRTAPTGISHGTITVIGHHFTCEVTTLREDIKTNGRHAIVGFGTSWQQDARRRDFTMNALSVDYQGQLYDYVEGFDDCMNAHVRFIGDPIQRIREDALRILRFLRFSAYYGQGPLDPEGLRAAKATQHLIKKLSTERITQELNKLLAAPKAERLKYIIRTAHQEKLLLDIEPNAEVIESLGKTHRTDPLLRLTLLLYNQPDQLISLAQKLRFSNKSKARLHHLLQALDALQSTPNSTGQTIRKLAYQFGIHNIDDAAYILSRTHRDPDQQYQSYIKPLKNWNPPQFPIKGSDLLKIGIAQGTDIGKTLKLLEKIWIDSDFQISQIELMRCIKK